LTVGATRLHMLHKRLAKDGTQVLKLGPTQTRQRFHRAIRAKGKINIEHGNLV
jgi:hypothetical protein